MKPTDIYDKAFFYTEIANIFSGIVQYATGKDLTNACSELMDSTLPDDYSRLAKFIKNRQEGCATNYKEFVRYYTQTTINEDEAGEYSRRGITKKVSY